MLIHLDSKAAGNAGSRARTQIRSKKLQEGREETKNISILTIH